jgi:hypothetical protein
MIRYHVLTIRKVPAAPETQRAMASEPSMTQPRIGSVAKSKRASMVTLSAAVHGKLTLFDASQVICSGTKLAQRWYIFGASHGRS